MKKIVLCAVFAIATMLVYPSSAHAGFGYFGTNGAFVILDANGGGNAYYHFQAGSANSAFQGTDFGSFNPTSGDIFVLNGGEQQTFENGGDNVLDGALWYRVYSGSPSGTFTSISYGTFTDLGSGNEKRTTTNAGINLLSSLTAGSYVLQVFNEANVDYNNQGGGAPEDIIWPNPTGGTLYNSASGNQAIASSRTATFTVVPEPGSLGLILGGGAFFLLRRRRA